MMENTDMSDAKFTKGPWSQSHRQGSDGMYNTEVYDHKGETICTLSWHPVYEGNGVTSTDRSANAHLIAAAPDMYKEVEREISTLECLLVDATTHGEADRLQNDIIRKVKILKKARGES